jgi:antitoxin (DNA-binding transcriptional repressor) of toxin-antitoxin stability system
VDEAEAFGVEELSLGMADRHVYIVSVSQAAEQLDALVRLAGHGEEIALARGGKVVARLVRASTNIARSKDSSSGKMASKAPKHADKARKTTARRGKSLRTQRMTIVEKLLELNQGNKASDADILSIVREGRKR